MQPAEARVARDELGEPGLVDRDLALSKREDTRLVDIDTHDVMAEVRETGTGDQADVARSDDGDLHAGTLSRAR